MFGIRVQFTDGLYKAADVNDQREIEWPPSPKRLFMGLVSTLYGLGEHREEFDHLRDALQWLERIESPDLYLPTEVEFSGPNKRYHPVKSKTGGRMSKKDLSGRQSGEKFHPKAHVEEPIYYVWPESDLEDLDDHIESDEDGETYLRSLVQNLPYLGRSESMVITSLESEIDTDDLPEDHRTEGEHPPGETAYVRTTREGTLEALEEIHDKITDESNDYEEEFFRDRNRNFRPYSRVEKKEEVQTDFSRMLVVRFLSPSESDTDHGGLKTKSVPRVAKKMPKMIRSDVFRDWIEANYPDFIPLLTGHSPEDGDQPLEDNHISFFPLLDVGHPYASGDFRGMALSFPKPDRTGFSEETIDEMYDMLGSILKSGPNGRDTFLYGGKFGDVPIELVEYPGSSEHPLFLSVHRYRGPAKKWATVTPWMPTSLSDSWREKRSTFLHDLEFVFGEELPKVVDLDILTEASSIQGTHHPMHFNSDCLTNGGVRQYHVEVEFDREVEGPLIVGKGQFKGMGLFMRKED